MKTLKQILSELREIKKELQSIASNLESIEKGSVEANTTSIGLTGIVRDLMNR